MTITATCFLHYYPLVFVCIYFNNPECCFDWKKGQNVTERCSASCFWEEKHTNWTKTCHGRSSKDMQKVKAKNLHINIKEQFLSSLKPGISILMLHWKTPLVSHSKLRITSGAVFCQYWTAVNKIWMLLKNTFKSSQS